jgi:uncharacterized membrane protein YfcA
VDLLGYGLATLMGVVLGTLGGGGSILTVPILVYVAGYDPKEAIGMSLAVVGVTSAIGAIGHRHLGNVRLRRAAIFAGSGVAGTLAGTRLATLLSGPVQLTLFAVVMLLAAGFMLRGSREPATAATPAPAAAAPPPRSFVLTGLDGLVIGVLTGVVGVGGGFLIVPALVVLGRLPMHQAVGTSLAVIAINALTGFIGYLDQIAVDWGFMLGFTACAVAGILAGSRLAGRIPARTLRRAFAIFLLVMGSFMLYRNRAVFLSHPVEQSVS